MDAHHTLQPRTRLYRKQYSSSGVYVSMKLSCSVVFVEDELLLLALRKYVRPCLLPVAKRQRYELTTV